MIYNVRIDRNNTQAIVDRITNDSELSIGWGGGVQATIPITAPDFVALTRNYHVLRSTRIPTNLTNLRRFQDHDVLVVPHLPMQGRFMILVVDGRFPDCYRYDENDETCLNHRIRVDRYVGLQQNLDIHNVEVHEWYARLPWLRLPILAIPECDGIFAQLLGKLTNDPNLELPQSEMEEFLDGLKQELVTTMLGRLRAMPAQLGNLSFERLCENLFRHHGYTIIRRNLYDGQGADTDLIVSSEGTGNRRDPFISPERRIHVQIKRHEGTTDEQAVMQILGRIEEDPLIDGIVISLADDFTERAKELAAKNGIYLIAGCEFCEILLSALQFPVSRN